MSAQLTLFGQQALARATDPETSIIAAQQLNLGEAQRLTLDASRKLLTHRIDATANEIASQATSMFGGLSETYRKRVGELCRKGLLTDIGVRTCTITHKVCTAYRMPLSQE